MFKAATIQTDPLPNLDSGTDHELCSLSVQGGSHGQNSYSRSRCTGLVGAVHRHDRHLVAGAGQPLAVLKRLRPGRKPQDDGDSLGQAGLGGGLGARASPVWASTTESRKPRPTMSALDFVHLHVHSSYSLLEGA